jgi:hypothetical protein
LVEPPRVPADGAAVNPESVQEELDDPDIIGE